MDGEREKWDGEGEVGMGGVGRGGVGEGKGGEMWSERWEEGNSCERGDPETRQGKHQEVGERREICTCTCIYMYISKMGTYMYMCVHVHVCT